MTTDPRAALDRLIAALEAHLQAASRRHGEADPAVVAAYQTLADAFETYDEALYTAYDEVTPFVLYDDAADEEDEDDEEEEDEEGEEEEEDFEEAEDLVDDDDLDEDDDLDDDLDDEDLEDDDEDDEDDASADPGASSSPGRRWITR